MFTEFRVAAVITAAGNGSRLGEDVPKALVRVRGRTLLEFSLERILAATHMQRVVVTCPAGCTQIFRATTEHLEGVEKVTFVSGGVTRQASVAAGLDALASFFVSTSKQNGPELDNTARKTALLVHDAARCLAPTSLVDDLVDEIRKGAGAVIPSVPVTDTIKVVDQKTGRVISTPKRANLRIVQTPQAFTWDVIRAAHKAANRRGSCEENAATDDAELVEQMGLPVSTISGSPLAFKVTVPDDLTYLERLVENM